MKWMRWMLLFAVVGCQDDPLPKPRGYFRIGLPEKAYYVEDTLDCPYQFETNLAAKWDVKKNCWADINYPGIRASVKLTYYSFDQKPLDQLLKDGQRMAYSHTIKADGMYEQPIVNKEENIYGMLYQIKGQVATSTQFYLTDSTQHFIRGVLYFYSQPNPDSLKPVNNFMKDEIVHMIETFKWKNG